MNRFPVDDLAILTENRMREMAVIVEAGENYVLRGERMGGPSGLPVSVRQADGDSANAIFDMCGLPEETSVAELARLVTMDPFRVAIHIVTIEGRLHLLEQRLARLNAR